MSVINELNVQDSQSKIDYFLFLLAMIKQQKRIDRLNKGKKKDVTLLDFISNWLNIVNNL
ncbi:MAG: hypothetical protein ACTHKK_01515 [Candidatus Nitrosocosmicus sp.]